MNSLEELIQLVKETIVAAAHECEPELEAIVEARLLDPRDIPSLLDISLATQVAELLETHETPEKALAAYKAI